MTHTTFFKQAGKTGAILTGVLLFGAPAFVFAQNQTTAVPAQTFTEYLDTKKPIAADEAKWNQFIAACQKAKGSPTSNYDSASTKDCLAADGKTTTKCVVATATCEGQSLGITPSTPTATTPNDQQGSAPAEFIPLTQLPQIKVAASASTLPAFLNQLYKICIGAGAALAVIMIMIGGVQIMTSSGSVTSNEKAKSHIQNAILGLVLILAPTIVFGIINPDILKLNLDVSGLKELSGTVGWNSASDTNSCTASFTDFKAVSSTATNACSTAGAGYTAAPSGCCDNLAAGSACCALPKTTNTIIGTFDPKIISVVNQALAFCGVQATDSQKSCMYSAEQSFALNPGTMIDAYSCIPTINGTQQLCVQQRLLSTSASAPTPSAQPTTTTPPPATTASAATGYGWALYMVPRGRTSPESLVFKGPFATSQACTDSLSTFLNENNVDAASKAPLCICSATIKSQPGCPVR